MNHRKIGLLCVAGASLVAALSLGGCAPKVTGDTARQDVSPLMESIAHTSELRKNRIAITVDTNARQVWDDLDALLLLDRPGRMSQYPIP